MIATVVDTNEFIAKIDIYLNLNLFKYLSSELVQAYFPINNLFRAGEMAQCLLLSRELVFGSKLLDYNSQPHVTLAPVDSMLFSDF